MGVRLDKGVLDGERGPVVLLSDEFNSSVLTFVDPITIGFSPSPLFVGRDKSLQKQLLFSRASQAFLSLLGFKPCVCLFKITIDAELRAFFIRP